MARPKQILFYYLSAFSSTGGIEKFNRCFIKALDELPSESFRSSVVSVCDTCSDGRYNKHCSFVGFLNNKARSVLHVLRSAFKHDILVLGHINLAAVGLLVKFINPRCKLVVIGHGIDIWDRFWFIKRLCLQKADLILAVSNYTKNQIVIRNNIDPKKIRLFPNTIDPYFRIPAVFDKPEYLLRRYNLKPGQKIIFTLSRLVSSEQYKGYDLVIAALPAVLKTYPGTVYLLAGKHDAAEKSRIEKLLRLHQAEKNVILTGFVDEAEVADHYNLADIFIMPSRKEGFGIVFLEALACGTAVIGGNQDGTVDALRNGSLGKLINPTKVTEIASAILSLLGQQKTHDPAELQLTVVANYGFDTFKERLKKTIAVEICNQL